MHDTSAPRFARMLCKLDAILARAIAFVEAFAAAQVDGSESRPVVGTTARRGLKVGAGGTAIPLVRSRTPATDRRLMGSRPSGSLSAGPCQAAG